MAIQRYHVAGSGATQVICAGIGIGIYLNQVHEKKVEKTAAANEEQRRLAAEWFDRQIKRIQASSTDTDSHIELYQYCVHQRNFRELAYRFSLDLLVQAGDQGLKVVALELGRLWCSGCRPDGAITMHDEQAIQNDIATRS